MRYPASWSATAARCALVGLVFSNRGMGTARPFACCVHMPSLPRKSGIAAAVENPAPVCMTKVPR